MTTRLALVTGASRGIGAAIARELAAAGCRILLNYRSDERGAAEVRDAIVAAGGEATLLRFDEVFGLRLAEWAPGTISIPEDVLALLQQREAARAEKRWKDADRLRDEIYDHGFDVEDTAKGPQLKPSKH